MSTTHDSIEEMVKRVTPWLVSNHDKSYAQKDGDIRAVYAARLYVGVVVGNNPYDPDLSRNFQGFKNQDGTSRTTYDPVVASLVMQINHFYGGVGDSAVAPPKNWRGGSGAP